ncbi:MAG: cell division protein FtsQ/DivIB [Clostridiaceae bacterium]
MSKEVKIIDKIDNTLIVKRRRKLFCRRILVVSVLLLTVISILCLKLSYFNIVNIEVENNKNLSSSKIIEMSRIQKGNNLFYAAILGSEKEISKNSYITSVKVKRKLPGTIILSVAEREAMYYNNMGSKYMVIDSKGILLEARTEISKMKLIKLDGFDLKKSIIGKQIVSSNTKRIQIINTLSEMTEARKFLANITEVDLTDPMAIIMYYGEIQLKLGNVEDLEKKLNTAANILQRDELKQAKKGYIDVSFKGNPVFYIEGN